MGRENNMTSWWNMREKDSRLVHHHARSISRMNLYSFAIGRKDGTWKEEFVESDSVVGAQSKVYEMYSPEQNPDVLFRLFLCSVEMEDSYVP